MKLLAGSYDNGAAIDDENAILASFQSRSQQVYQQVRVECNIPYGDSSREVFDWFYSTGEHKGTLVFLHGGYWQFCNKEDFAFIAETPLLLGFDVVLVEYTLAPAVNLEDICQQIGMALDTIELRAKSRGNKPVYLCGHSAGGHLAAYWQHHSCIQAVFPISGIFELEPLLNTYVNQQLQLTALQISALSPARNIPQQLKPMILFYGAAELPELIGQSLHYYKALKEKGLSVNLHAVTGANHFNVLDSLFATGGALSRQLIKQGDTSDAHSY
ncbi:MULTISPECIES: alpha/beta hydrolase [unclassified Serratia (in: enterobacteria)]|uniref:alpha/beta hydrolase n=1 Tax=unclassified Serratia (in: enterobacteria) TaxID=2647522 RepID=UPI000503CBCC|nr:MULTISPECIES: alpha/beta hydrolase [unclassified Serratia (in: enterobacteria)]KFK96577.1 esterase [Serratia sp. Ag2]KFK99803.1 esterase [Serratia sp. Ag1]